MDIEIHQIGNRAFSFLMEIFIGSILILLIENLILIFATALAAFAGAAGAQIISNRKDKQQKIFTGFCTNNASLSIVILIIHDSRLEIYYLSQAVMVVWRGTWA